MKKPLIVLSFCAAISPPILAGGIPVIDVASITQQITQVQHMITQIEQYRQQIETTQRQLQQISGSRGMSSLINTAYDLSMEYNEAQIASDNGFKTSDEVGFNDGTNQAFRNIYDESRSNATQRLARSQLTLQQSKDRYNQLLPLVQKLNDSPDQKDTLDLMARINAESVLLQNELVKLESAKAESEALEQAEKQKMRQLAIESSGELRPWNLPSN